MKSLQFIVFISYHGIFHSLQPYRFIHTAEKIKTRTDGRVNANIRDLSAPNILIFFDTNESLLRKTKCLVTFKLCQRLLFLFYLHYFIATVTCKKKNMKNRQHSFRFQFKELVLCAISGHHFGHYSSSRVVRPKKKKYNTNFFSLRCFTFLLAGSLVLHNNFFPCCIPCLKRTIEEIFNIK